jgi:hypothetical protein
VDRTSGGVRGGGHGDSEHRSRAEVVKFERSEDYQDNHEGTFDDYDDEGFFSGERSVDEVDVGEGRPRRWFEGQGREVDDDDDDDGQGQRLVEEEWFDQHRIDVDDDDHYDDDRHRLEADERGR